MWYIIGGIIVLIIIFALFQWLADLVGGAGKLIAIIIILIAAFFIWSWNGVLAAAAICTIVCIVVKVIEKAGKYVGDQVEQHDKNKRETAQINQKTEREKQIHINDVALMEELSKNCYWLGYMSDDM